MKYLLSFRYHTYHLNSAYGSLEKNFYIFIANECYIQLKTFNGYIEVAVKFIINNPCLALFAVIRLCLFSLFSNLYL